MACEPVHDYAKYHNHGSPSSGCDLTASTSPTKFGHHLDVEAQKELGRMRADPVLTASTSPAKFSHHLDVEAEAERERVLEAARQAVHEFKTKEEEDNDCFQKCFKKTQTALMSVEQIEMDQEILNNLTDDHEIDEWGKSKLRIDDFGKKFGNVITVFVLLNAMTIGIETDFAQKYTTVRSALDVLEHIYCCVFLVEMIIRIVVNWKEYFTQPMSLIDFVLVNFAVFDTWFLPLALGSGVGIGQLSMLRIIRLLRLVRLIKLMRSYKKLYLLVTGLIAGLKTLAWVGLLMFITIYMFAIFCVQTIGKNPDYSEEVWLEKYPDSEFSSEKYFKNIFTSMLTMWECLNDGCTHDVVRPVISEKPYYFPVFLSFTFLMVYGFLNILVGVFCDSITESAEEQEEMFKRQEEIGEGSWEHQIRTLWNTVNLNLDGNISRAEFFDAFDTETLQGVLMNMNLGNVEANEIFSTLDLNNDGSLWKEELVEGLMKFKSGLSNPTLTTFMIKKRTEAELGRLMDLMDKIGDLLQEQGFITNITKCVKPEEEIDYKSIEAEGLPDVGEGEARAGSKTEAVTTPVVRKAMQRIEDNMQGTWDLRFSNAEMEEKYLESLWPSKLVFLKVSVAVQAGETISRAVFEDDDLSPGANSLRAAFSAFCTLATLVMALLLRKCLKDEVPWPMRWTVQRVMTAVFMVKLVGSVLLRPCRLAVALGFEVTEVTCTPDLWWEVVLLLYTVLGTWLPSRFQNQLLATSLVARVVVLLVLDLGLLDMGGDSTLYFHQEFLPILALFVILVFSCYAFDMERRSAFLMRHCLEKQQARELKKEGLKGSMEAKTPTDEAPVLRKSKSKSMEGDANVPKDENAEAPKGEEANVPKDESEKAELKGESGEAAPAAES